MKIQKLILALTLLLFTVGVAVSANADPGDYNLSMEAILDGEIVPQTVFRQGDILYLHVILDNGTDVAGTAFTLTFDNTRVAGPATDAEGLPVNADDISSLFPFTYVQTDPPATTITHRANSSEANKIYFAGAEIDKATGGGKYGTGANITLATVKFIVDSNAPLGTHTFGLEQTELFNPDAGWGTDNNGNGIYEPGSPENDTKGIVPILVGAVPCCEPPWGGDLSDDFPNLTPDLGPLPSLEITILCLDTDEDGLCDEDEINTYFTDPNDADSDDDGLNDGDEVDFGSDPNDPDSDNDGYSDYWEKQNGTDPNTQDEAGIYDGYDPCTDDRASCSVELTLPAGWSLISLPVTPDDANLTALFPDAGVAYSYDGSSYQLATTLEPGNGYWINLSTGGTYTITGPSYSQYSTTLIPGWHLLGAVDGTATPTTDPAGEVTVIYGFDGTAYSIATELVTGKGYWVNINGDCDFNVGTP